MHNLTTRLRMYSFFVVLLVCALALAGCHSSASKESGGKPVINPQVVPPLVVTNPPDTGKPASGMPSADKHSAYGVTCEQCHETAAPTMAPNSNRTCLGCHKADALIKSTAKYDDVKHKSQNPHDSHIHGASCMVCHKNHGESILYCDQCHKPPFGWKVP
jgi:hypothetical protein